MASVSLPPLVRIFGIILVVSVRTIIVSAQSVEVMVRLYVWSPIALTTLVCEQISMPAVVVPTFAVWAVDHEPFVVSESAVIVPLPCSAPTIATAISPVYIISVVVKEGVVLVPPVPPKALTSFTVPPLSLLTCVSV